MISIALSIGGIVIGLVIAIHQHEQGRRIENQGEGITNIVNRLGEQNARMGDMVSQVDRQTSSMADMLHEVRTMNAQVRDMIREVRVREDRRKYYHLYHVREHTDSFRERVVKMAEIVEDRYINKTRPKDDEHKRTSKYIRNTIEQLKWQTNQIKDHFEEVKDLINSPGLASRVLVNYLGSTMGSLADVLHHTDPMYTPQDLFDSLQELKEQQIPKLDQAIQEIEQEIPKMGSHRPSEHVGRQDTPKR